MKTHLLYIAFLIFLLILNLVQIFRIKAVRSQAEIILEQSKSYEDKLNVNRLNQALTFELNLSKLDREMILFDKNDVRMKLNQLVLNGPTLVLKYSSLNCLTCIEEQISQIKRTMNLIGLKNILILANYTSSAELSRFKRLNQLDLTIFNLKEYELTSFDKGFPYFFILDDSFSLKELYIPLRGDTLMTEKYLQAVVKKYF